MRQPQRLFIRPYMEPDRRLLDIYDQVVYHVTNPAFVLRPRVLHVGWDTWLAGHGWDCWGFITAWNPGGVKRMRMANDTAQDLLRADLSGAGYTLLEGFAQGIGDWPDEPGYFVPGAGRDALLYLGSKYGQVAVLYGVAGRPPEVVACPAAVG